MIVKSYKKILSWAPLFSALLLANQALFAEDNHAAHVHGLSELVIVVEGQDVMLEFMSPAMNLVGFEHAAVSKQDQQTLAATVKQLSAVEQLITFKGTDCSVEDVTVDAADLQTDMHKDHHDEHAHHGEHDHHQVTTEAEHYDVSAQYHYRCKNTKKLSAIQVDFFKRFHGIEKIHAQWITASQQQAEQLNAKNNTIRLK